MTPANTVFHKGQTYTLGPVESIVMDACRRRRGYDDLVALTGSPRKSLHSIVCRLRRGGLLRASAPGTTEVTFKATARKLREERRDG